jgi:hypothetical protein
MTQQFLLNRHILVQWVDCNDWREHNGIAEKPIMNTAIKKVRHFAVLIFNLCQ